jgi:hypothetical protein
MEQKPNYYGIMSADVRYNKNLSSSEKIMYVEITALSNKHGYCHASNSYFADLYGVTKKTVSSWVKGLEREGVIRVEYKWGKGKQVEERRLYPTQKDLEGMHKNVMGYAQKSEGGMHKKVKGNNTSINNIKYTSFLDLWNEVNGTDLRITDKKRTQIKARLNTFTEDEIKQSIRNRSQDEWINGEGRKYKGNWDSFWRNDDKVERYLKSDPKDSWEVQGYESIDIL